jgi:hypothetical protein
MYRIKTEERQAGTFTGNYIIVVDSDTNKEASFFVKDSSLCSFESVKELILNINRCLIKLDNIKKDTL